MNRWQAYTAIVREFLKNGHPLYALAALGLIILPPVVAGVVAYSIGRPAVTALAGNKEAAEKQQDLLEKKVDENINRTTRRVER